MTQTIDELVQETCDLLGYTSDVSIDSPHERARFELFHTSKSICAQKVRAVLGHHKIPYTSRQIDILKGHNFLPSYVRLRLIGCASIGSPLVSRHDGSTSVDNAGCDPCVVPTLIDHANDTVLVDSRRICLFLDQTMPEGQRLRPPQLADAIDGEMERVDDIPNIQLLMSKSPDGEDNIATKQGQSGEGYTKSRIAFGERFRAEHADDPELVEAYSAKIAKESRARSDLFTPEAVKVAYARTRAACRKLESKLAATEAQWIFGNDVSMADLFWGLELIRLKNLGTTAFWDKDELPHVRAYLHRIEGLPAIKQALLDDSLF